MSQNRVSPPPLTMDVTEKRIRFCERIWACRWYGFWAIAGWMACWLVLLFGIFGPSSEHASSIALFGFLGAMALCFIEICFFVPELDY